MKLHFADINKQVIDSLKIHFKDFPDVIVHHANILEIAEHCIVSPANSHGFMDGGIDNDYLDFFGKKIEKIVQNAILRRPEGFLPVGASILVKTLHPVIPYMIVAPTMEMPEAVPAINAGRAMQAVLRIVTRGMLPEGDIYCPGLGTLTGMIPSEKAARKMALAYQDWKNRMDKTI